MTTEIKQEGLTDNTPVALVTGGSAGLGRALVGALADRGWTVLTDGRDAAALDGVRRWGVVAVPGDVADAAHRRRLRAEVEDVGRLDLLVHNASTLGPLPMRPLAELDPADLAAVWAVNVAAPHALTRDLLPWLTRSHGTLLAITSDAAVEHYETWGPYAATKAALEHLTLTFGVENPGLTAYAVDPGDLRTAMHQAAFPGEDISDRPLPDQVLPRLLGLLGSTGARPVSGRYRAADLPEPRPDLAATRTEVAR